MLALRLAPAVAALAIACTHTASYRSPRADASHDQTLACEHRCRERATGAAFVDCFSACPGARRVEAECPAAESYDGVCYERRSIDGGAVAAGVLVAGVFAVAGSLLYLKALGGGCWSPPCDSE